jgi:hypothetical protein
MPASGAGKKNGQRFSHTAVADNENSRSSDPLLLSRGENAVISVEKRRVAGLVVHRHALS